MVRMSEKQIFIAKTMHGLEPALAAELTRLGATGIQEIKRAVMFEGDRRLLYEANYNLRTALRILVPIRTFQARNEKALYEGIRNIDWSKYMGVNDTLAVDAIVQSEVFRHSQYAGLLTKDAVVDQFRDKYNKRPNVNVLSPHLRINLHIHDITCDVSLDSSGDSLHKRGYRTDTVEAPLNEILAAVMIQLSGWDGNSDFVDPMCGSGTLAIEAALVATNTSPHFKRDTFGFFKWPDFDQKTWNVVRSGSDAKRRVFNHRIYASDLEGRARNATSINAMKAGLEHAIHIDRIPFEKLSAPSGNGVLITNPPYDERMRVEDIIDFYKSIGDQFKKNWSGWDAWVISSNRDALKHLGLRASRRITLFNGALECSFQKFQMYEGSKNGSTPPPE